MTDNLVERLLKKRMRVHDLGGVGFEIDQDCVDAASEITRLQEALAAAEAGGWQPIETAPKDGTAVILYCPQGDGNPGSTYRVTAGQWLSSDGGTTEYRDSEGRWIGQDDEEPWAGWVSMDGGFSEDTMMPTHWQPLPAPPFHLPNKEDRNG